MARRRKGKRSKDEVRSIARKSLGYIKVAVGTLGFGHGVVRAVAMGAADGTWGNTPNRVIYFYTGYDQNQNRFDQNQLISSIGTMAATAVAVKMIGWGQKQLR